MLKRLLASEEVNLKQFFEILNAYFYNFRVLHWKTKCENFDEYHELMNEYYDKLNDDIDLIAEIMLSNDIEVSKLSSIDEALYIDVYKNYNENEIVEETNKMFESILKYINRLLNEDSIVVKNPGIKSELENLYSYYDKELSYKNKRRKY